jgi:hypothetical protein
MFWLWLYIAAMFLVALPVAWFSRNEAAAAIFATWSIGHAAYELGMPEPQTQTVLYGVMFCFMCARILSHLERWTWRCIASAMFFLPLFTVCYEWSGDRTMDPWWPIYVLAWLQLGFIVRPVVWFRSARGWIVRAREDWSDHFSMAAP